ncbi:MAG: hypothetical protein ABJL99_14045 [Aliishimia sp.]
MHAIRTILTLAICLTLGLTGQAMAFARGQAPAEGQMVICAGHATYIVYTDSEGQPTSPPQLCSDCLVSLDAIVPTAQSLLLTMLHVSQVAMLRAAQTAQGAVQVEYEARAPPAV